MVAVPTDLGNAYTQGSISNWVGDGYTFDIAFTMSIGGASSEIANATPGNANITWQNPVTISVKNTTAGRNSDWNHLAGLQVAGLWNASSPACTAVAQTSIIHSWDNYCFLTFGGIGSGGGTPLSIGESMSLGFGKTFSAVSIPEGTATAAVSALDAGPDAWVVEAGGYSNQGCGDMHIMWSSLAALSCTSVSTLGPEGP
ncbi:MAG TPA: hypothetical protein VIJ11_08945, partial [Galbitalea sp.]